MANKYNYFHILALSILYGLGLSRDESCKQIGIPSGSFSYLMKKFGFTARPKGFQSGNDFGTQFQKGNWHQIHCLFCNKLFQIPDWEMKKGRSFCNMKCRSRFYAKRGIDHHNWQGGKSNQWDMLHNSAEYKEWRIHVFQRDYFHCQHCWQSSRKENPLHAHHIKSKSKFPELILDINNGLTLCKLCHDRVHYPHTYKNMHPEIFLHSGRHR